MSGVSNRARIEAYIGASGSGKGVSIKRRLAELAPARLLIWDPRDEYGASAAPVNVLPELVAKVGAAGAGGFRIRYVPGGRVKLPDAFAIVCRLAFGAGSLTLLAEELSDVTTPGYAPPAWRQITTQGRHRSLHVLGAAQRPSLIDKTFLGNATLIRCGALGYDVDRKRMAIELDCGLELVQRLESAERAGGGAEILMLERDRQRRALEWVRLDVSKAGRVAERRENVTPGPLRGTSGHVNAKRLQSTPAIPQSARKAPP